MSSAGYLCPTNKVGKREWDDFCRKFSVEKHLESSSSNVYYYGGLGGVEIKFRADRIIFSTFHRGNAVNDVAKMLLVAWDHFGGSIEADDEIMSSILVTIRDSERIPAMTAKKTVDDMSDAELHQELKRRAEERDRKAREEADAENESFVLALRGGNVVDALAPKHELDGCDDLERKNAWYTDNGRPECLRCYLLMLTKDEWVKMETDYRPVFKLELRGL